MLLNNNDQLTINAVQKFFECLWDHDIREVRLEGSEITLDCLVRFANVKSEYRTISRLLLTSSRADPLHHRKFPFFIGVWATGKEGEAPPSALEGVLEKSYHIIRKFVQGSEERCD